MTRMAAWVFMGLLASSAAVQAADWGGFEAPIRFPMGAPVVSLTASESAGGSSIVVGTNGLGASVFRGFARGSFQQRRDIPGGFVVSVAMADLNADGIPDLAVPSYFGASFTVYLGAPDGSFAPGETYPVAGHCTWVATGDFNEDGRVDIAAARNGSGLPMTLYVYLGNGDGTFRLFQTYPTQLATPTEIAVTRVNSDDHYDLAYSLSGPGTGALFLGNGDGTFGTPEILTDGADPRGDSPGFKLADVDGDGNLDWVDAQDFVDSVAVRMGQGTGQFVTAPGLSFPHPFDVETTDLDGDGSIDIVVSNVDSAVCYLHQNGGFVAAATIHSAGGAIKLRAADVDGDGLPDLVFSGTDNSFSVAINRGHSMGAGDPPPPDVALLPNRPNPVDRSTVFRYRLSQPGDVRLVLYDVCGRRIATLADGASGSGTHDVGFDASHLAAGGYFYRLYIRDAVLSGRMTVVR